MTFFSLVRTNAPPLPGLTCWNSTTFQSWPSMLRVIPFLRSFVVATSVRSCSAACGAELPRLKDEQLPGDGGERRGGACRPVARADDEGVLDPDAASAWHVDPGLYCDS